MEGRRRKGGKGEKVRAYPQQSHTSLSCSAHQAAQLAKPCAKVDLASLPRHNSPHRVASGVAVPRVDGVGGVVGQAGLEGAARRHAVALREVLPAGVGDHRAGDGGGALPGGGRGADELAQAGARGDAVEGAAGHCAVTPGGGGQGGRKRVIQVRLLQASAGSPRLRTHVFLSFRAGAFGC